MRITLNCSMEEAKFVKRLLEQRLDRLHEMHRFALLKDKTKIRDLSKNITRLENLINQIGIHIIRGRYL